MFSRVFQPISSSYASHSASVKVVKISCQENDK